MHVFNWKNIWFLIVLIVFTIYFPPVKVQKRKLEYLPYRFLCQVKESIIHRIVRIFLRNLGQNRSIIESKLINLFKSDSHGFFSHEKRLLFLFFFQELSSSSLYGFLWQPDHITSLEQDAVKFKLYQSGIGFDIVS